MSELKLSVLLFGQAQEKTAATTYFPVMKRWNKECQKADKAWLEEG